MILVNVRYNNVDQALRALKKKMQRERRFSEMKRMRTYEKGSDEKNRKRMEKGKKMRKQRRS